MVLPSTEGYKVTDLIKGFFAMKLNTEPKPNQLLVLYLFIEKDALPAKRWRKPVTAG